MAPVKALRHSEIPQIEAQEEKQIEEKTYEVTEEAMQRDRELNVLHQVAKDLLS